MSFAEYIHQWMSSQRPLFEVAKPEPDEEKGANSDLDEIEELILSGVGGDPANEKDRMTSFDSLEKVLERLDVTILEKIQTQPELQRILMLLTLPEKVEMVEAFVKRSRKNITQIKNEKKKIKPDEPFKKFFSLKTRESEISSQVYKIFKIFDYASTAQEYDPETSLMLYFKENETKLKFSTREGTPLFTIKLVGGVHNAVKSDEFVIVDQNGNEQTLKKSMFKKVLEVNPEIVEDAKKATSESNKNKIDRVLKKANETITKEIADSIADDEERINEIPNTPEGSYRLNVDWKPLLDALGYSQLYAKAIGKKEQQLEKVEKPSLRRKNLIKNNLISALNMALLPPIVNGEVTAPGGDYFRLFRTLQKRNSAWMENAISNMFQSLQRAAQFKSGPAVKESALEEDQLAYLELSKQWILKYIKSSEDGELSDRDRTSAVTKVENIAAEKQKQIKNSYLSRDFNMGNFKGIQLKPDLKLPLYVRIKLAVSEKDRIAESPLKNILKGLGQLVVGLFAGIPDAGDAAVAARNAKQNQAIFNGIASILKAGVLVTAGKQAGRDFDKGLKKATAKARLDVVGLTPYEEGEGPKFYKSAEMKESEGTMTPGTAFQTPDTMVDSNMDTLSLAGPGKKKKEKEKKSIVKKISNFSDFMKNRD
jgi:predicted nucleic acid binding AN1-type Zn finger protein